MPSGIGIYTEKGRCFQAWCDYRECTALVRYPNEQCKDVFDEYLECLHQTTKKKEAIKTIEELRARSRILEETISSLDRSKDSQN